VLSLSINIQHSTFIQQISSNQISIEHQSTKLQSTFIKQGKGEFWNT